jgi:hypothetical protein
VRVCARALVCGGGVGGLGRKMGRAMYSRDAKNNVCVLYTGMKSPFFLSNFNRSRSGWTFPFTISRREILMSICPKCSRVICLWTDGFMGWRASEQKDFHGHSSAIRTHLHHKVSG